MSVYVDNLNKWCFIADSKVNYREYEFNDGEYIARRE